MRRLTFGLVCSGLVLGVTPVLAQPIIIPLERQNQPQPTPPPVVSAPPIAPPQAGPSLPATTDTAGATKADPQEEAASQPTPR